MSISNDTSVTAAAASASTSIQNKVVLITGANRGIGKALVDACIEKGDAKVYAGVRTLSSAQPLVDCHGSNKIIPIHMDMLQPDTIEAAAKKIASDNANDDGSNMLDIVIHNAGTLSATGALAENAVPQLQHEMEVNVFSLLHMARHFSPLLKDGGVFCQMNSAASLRSFAPELATYAATKAASFSITQALRVSLKEQGTRVVSVHPGPIQTDMIGPFAHLINESQTTEDCATAILESIEDGTSFLCYPDPQAQRLGKVYSEFATHVFQNRNAY